MKMHPRNIFFLKATHSAAHVKCGAFLRPSTCPLRQIVGTPQVDHEKMDFCASSLHVPWEDFQGKNSVIRFSVSLGAVWTFASLLTALKGQSD